MRNHNHPRLETLATRSLRQRIVACLLLLLVVFLIVNPIFECHDHLDNLCHLGPHGFLVILLLAACAGLGLMVSRRWSPDVSYSVIRRFQTPALFPRASHRRPSALSSEPHLSLRI